MCDINKCRVHELQDILYNINAWINISRKIGDIYTAHDIVTDMYKPENDMMRSILTDMRTIEKICEKMEITMERQLKKYGIYVESNLDVMEIRVRDVLKRKICAIILKDETLSEHTRINIRMYVEKYFQNYDMAKRTYELTNHIKEWIRIVQQCEDIMS